MDLSHWRPVVSEEAFAYLAIQRGKQSDLLADRQAWLKAYRDALVEQYLNIAPYLPEGPRPEILDVGGGMGGIDVLLYRHYSSHAFVSILDGFGDPPAMARHGETFSNAFAACRFLIANELNELHLCINPLAEADRFDHAFNLVISFSAWCFHFSPGLYLRAVKTIMAPGAVAIIDVRRSKPEWRRELEDAFGPGAVIHTEKKFERMVFNVR